MRGWAGSQQICEDDRVSRLSSFGSGTSPPTNAASESAAEANGCGERSVASDSPEKRTTVKGVWGELTEVDVTI